jgi:hypothetical protein
MMFMEIKLYIIHEFVKCFSLTNFVGFTFCKVNGVRS